MKKVAEFSSGGALPDPSARHSSEQWQHECPPCMKLWGRQRCAHRSRRTCAPTAWTSRLVGPSHHPASSALTLPRPDVGVHLRVFRYTFTHPYSPASSTSLRLDDTQATPSSRPRRWRYSWRIEGRPVPVALRGRTFSAAAA